MGGGQSGGVPAHAGRFLVLDSGVAEVDLGREGVGEGDGNGAWRPMVKVERSTADTSRFPCGGSSGCLLYRCGGPSISAAPAVLTSGGSDTSYFARIAPIAA